MKVIVQVGILSGGRRTVFSSVVLVLKGYTPIAYRCILVTQYTISQRSLLDLDGSSSTLEFYGISNHHSIGILTFTSVLLEIESLLMPRCKATSCVQWAAHN